MQSIHFILLGVVLYAIMFIIMLYREIKNVEEHYALNKMGYFALIVGALSIFYGLLKM